MKGSVKKRGATWYWWADLPRGAVGKRNRKSVGGFRTRRECEADLALHAGGDRERTRSLPRAHYAGGVCRGVARAQAGRRTAPDHGAALRSGSNCQALDSL